MENEKQIVKKAKQLSDIHKLGRLMEDMNADTKLDRNLRIVTGVITVLGVAASTCMKIMQTEKVIRDRKARMKKSTTKKRPPKRKIGKPKAPEDVELKQLRHLQVVSNQVLKATKRMAKGGQKK